MAAPAPAYCPRCGAATLPSAIDCGRCGIVFAKYDARRPRQRQVVAPEPAMSSPGASASHSAEHQAVEDLPPDPSWPVVMVGRALLWVVLAVWTARFASYSVASNYTGESVLHLVNLVFHEAGHVLFAPFGQFLTVAGGSLLQVLVPLTCSVAFLRAHNRFGASVGAWWAGQNLVDLAPYINDARALRLVLLGGRTGTEVEGHDWEYLLGALGWLRHDHALAGAAHATGQMVMGMALAWGVALLWRQWQRGRGPHTAEAPHGA